MKRLVCAALTIICTMMAVSLSIAQSGDGQALEWGMSRSAFRKSYSSEEFIEKEVGGKKALMLSGVRIDEYTMDVYYYFGEKADGKSYYGLSDIVYLIPAGSKMFSGSALKKNYDGLVKIVTNQYGKPVSNKNNQALWTTDYFTIAVITNSFEMFTGSSYETVGVVYSSLQADQETTETESASSPSGSSVKMTVKASAKCSNYNHIGDKWETIFYINNKKVSETSTITLKAGDTITVKARISENDSNPDVGEASETYVVTKTDIAKGFKISFNVKVTENGGRYNGYSATWRVTFSFSN